MFFFCLFFVFFLLAVDFTSPLIHVLNLLQWGEGPGGGGGGGGGGGHAKLVQLAWAEVNI